MNTVTLTTADISFLAKQASRKIARPIAGSFVTFYAIPRGGVPAALAIAAEINRDRGYTVRYTDDPAKADYIVDDLIDSGETMRYHVSLSKRPDGNCATPLVLINKYSDDNQYSNKWIVFPWEGDSAGSMEDNVRRMLQFVGEDATRGGLLETPARVAKAWQFWAKGYNEDPAEILKVFEDGAEGCDEMVMVKDIPFYTHCEHHMAPFFGRATVGYIPDGKIVGLSKINRVVDCFARRLQVQERLTTQVADAIMEHLQPRGVGVIVNARHLCMESRGVCQQGHSTITSALRGVMSEGVVRQEFLHLAK